MKIKLLDGIAEVGVDITYFMAYRNTKLKLWEDTIDSLMSQQQPNLIVNGGCCSTPSFLYKSSLLFYLIENDLPYNEEDFIEVEPIDYTNFLVKEELKEISTELLRNELAHRGYAVDNLWSIHDVLGDMTDVEKLTKVNTVLNSGNVKSYINECLND